MATDPFSGENLSGVVHNELIAITAGAGLLGFATFLQLLIRSERVNSEARTASLVQDARDQQVPGVCA